MIEAVTPSIIRKLLSLYGALKSFAVIRKFYNMEAGN